MPDSPEYTPTQRDDSSDSMPVILGALAQPGGDAANAGTISVYPDGVTRIAPAREEDARWENFRGRLAKLGGRSPFDVLGFTPQMLEKHPPPENPSFYQRNNLTDYPAPAYKKLVEEYNRAARRRADALEKLENFTATGTPAERARALAQAHEEHAQLVERESEKWQHDEDEALARKNAMGSYLYHADALLRQHLAESWAYHQEIHKGFVARLTRALGGHVRGGSHVEISWPPNEPSARTP